MHGHATKHMRAAIFGGLLLGWSVGCAEGGSSRRTRPVPDTRASATAVAAKATSHGPAAGTLIIVGGGHPGDEIVEEFVRRAGGSDAPVVIIPTAAPGDAFGLDWTRKNLWTKRFPNATVLHTRDRNVADSEEFVAPLRRARGVWIGGGRQWRLVDAYLHTRTQTELRAVLDRGGVIGGTSAGASIQASYLRDNAINVDGAHEHVRKNPAGFVFEIGCFRDAPGCAADGPPSEEWSWFPGYAWRVGLCAGCGVHLGWVFVMSSARFFGLIVERLVLDESRRGSSRLGLGSRRRGRSDDRWEEKLGPRPAARELHCCEEDEGRCAGVTEIHMGAHACPISGVSLPFSGVVRPSMAFAARQDWTADAR